MADNSYPVTLKLGSANGYYTPAQALNAYGKYNRTGVTYHWWNTPNLIADTDHYNIVNFMYRNSVNGDAPTVNYVASMTALTMMINPDNAAWCSNNGNATTISVECSPHFTANFYKKLGWLHDQLEQRYGRTLALYRHSDWTPTSCSPIDLGAIRREADAWKAQRNVPAPAPAPTPVPPTVTVSVQDITNKKVKIKAGTNLWDLGFTKYADAKGIQNADWPARTDRIIEVSAEAKHPLGSTYYLTEYSFAKGIKNGINVKDCEDYVDVVAPPTPVKTVEPPVVVQVPVLTTEQRLGALESLVAKIVEFLTGLGFKK